MAEYTKGEAADWARENLRGQWTTLMTPFTEDDELDDLMLHYAEYNTDHPPEESPMGPGFRAESEALRGV